MDIQFLKGIGEKRARLFYKLGLFTVDDVLRFYPRAYEDRTRFVKISELLSGQWASQLSIAGAGIGSGGSPAACFAATVASPVTGAHIRKGLDIYKTKVFDETGELHLTFFNAPYVKNALVRGENYVFYGQYDGRGTMVNPVFEAAASRGEREGQTGDKTGRILPVYRATAGLSQGALRNAVKQALEKLDPVETLPGGIRQTYNLAAARFAVENIHYPQTEELLAAARRRLVFEELLLLQLGLAVRRGKLTKTPGPVFKEVDMRPFFAALPFELTAAQTRAIEDIAGDICRGAAPLNRLIQGDVGSGKTAVAAAAAYMAFKNGYQTALMVPTEILAEQHARSLTELFGPFELRVGMLTGRSKKAEDADLTVGTQALISENVSFSRLGLVITDEQHRFGVEQRAKLFAKGKEPHRLIMSATPIPRTLSRILYGDLDVTVMQGLPPGRTPVKTYPVDEGYRPRIEAFVRKTAEEGGQVYIVCPVIDENEELNLQSADVYAEKAKEIYPGLRTGLLHGKIKAKEKERVMRAFAAGEIDILVATAVIEVGVDVPNASLIVIENAERFGLSQLHQLRGRVGRGSRKSHCVLFMQNESARQRLTVLKNENDGFAVAEADLRLRGPGDFFGNRQHGLPEFKIADLSNDMEILQASREASEALLPVLREHPALQAAVEALLHKIEGGD